MKSGDWLNAKEREEIDEWPTARFWKSSWSKNALRWNTNTMMYFVPCHSFLSATKYTLSETWGNIKNPDLNREGQKVFFAQLVNHVRTIMQTQRVWNIQRWSLTDLKRQLPGPQQGTDRESQKPQLRQALDNQIFDSTRERLTEDKVWHKWIRLQNWTSKKFESRDTSQKMV